MVSGGAVAEPLICDNNRFPLINGPSPEKMRQRRRKSFHWSLTQTCAGGKIISFPGEKVPKWFNHCTNVGGSISFWFRNKFPGLTLCVAIGLKKKYEKPLKVKFNPYVIINNNGNKKFCGSGIFGHTSFSLVADHIFVFDLDTTEFEDRVAEEITSPEEEWNHVEISFGKFAKESGIYVLKQKSKMEDIRFTNPYIDDNEGNIEICSSHAPSSEVVTCLDLTMSTRIDHIAMNGDNVNNAERKEIVESSCIKEENGRTPPKLLSLTKVRKLEKDEATNSNDKREEIDANDKQSMRDDEDKSPKWQFSLCALISSILSLCSSSSSLTAP
ncbi:TMV resistance protein N [Senna tora]|uniref:TMV resistance protein N n=1 Tax=Senna tora TaxID=362788 RepID=A0A834T357_9FABA|nr:TMV resistance protein N [Senna tora]